MSILKPLAAVALAVGMFVAPIDANAFGWNWFGGGGGGYYSGYNSGYYDGYSCGYYDSYDGYYGRPYYSDHYRGW
jgi:hypothetical protein